MGYVIGFYGINKKYQQWWVLFFQYLHDVLDVLDVDVQIEADILQASQTLLASSGAVWKIPGDVDTLNPPIFAPFDCGWAALTKGSLEWFCELQFRKSQLSERKIYRNYNSLILQELMAIYMK